MQFIVRRCVLPALCGALFIAGCAAETGGDFDPAAEELDSNVNVWGWFDEPNTALVNADEIPPFIETYNWTITRNYCRYVFDRYDCGFTTTEEISAPLPGGQSYALTPLRRVRGFPPYLESAYLNYCARSYRYDWSPTRGWVETSFRWCTNDNILQPVNEQGVPLSVP